MSVEHIGAASNCGWPVTTYKDTEIATQTHHEQQNGQFSNFEMNSFGACTCAPSSHPHFLARDNKKAAARPITTPQQKKSVITIRKSTLKVRKHCKSIRGCRKGCSSQRPLSSNAWNEFCKENCEQSIPSSMRTSNGRKLLFRQAPCTPGLFQGLLASCFSALSTNPRYANCYNQCYKQVQT